MTGLCQDRVYECSASRSTSSANSYSQAHHNIETGGQKSKGGGGGGGGGVIVCGCDSMCVRVTKYATVCVLSVCVWQLCVCVTE